MVQGKWFPMGVDISQALWVRQQVFGATRDALDDVSQQVVVYGDEQRPVGAARLWWEGGAFALGDVGVLTAERGRGYGDLLVRLLLYKALTHNAVRVTLTAPEAVAPFFARYGFCDDGASGDGMRRMSMLARDIQLSHCGGDCAACAHPSPECAPKALRE